jgi:hypothetical protein
VTRTYLTRTAQFVAVGVAVLALASYGAATAYGSIQGSAREVSSARHHPYGMVIGKLVREDGPIRPGGRQPKETPVPGLIRFTAANHKHLVVRVRVSRHGRFAVKLPSGRYNVLGHSPGLEVSGQAWCSQPLTVTVRPHRTAKITVVCPVP